MKINTKLYNIAVKNSFFCFLVWCAGADIDILKNKARFSEVFICGRSEQIKLAWTGALVLIPPTFAFCGMLYAAATLRISHSAVIFLTLIWSIIIFVFERYIVSSFRKSNSVKKDLFSITFFIRFCFAIGVGFTIADPLVLGIFNDDIEKKLSELNQAEIVEINNDASISINKQLARKDTIDKAFKERERQIDSFDSKLTDEIDGISATHHRGFGVSAKAKKDIRDRRLNEKQKQYTIDSISKSVIDFNIARIEIERNKKVENKKFSNDYLAHRHALAALVKDPNNKDIRSISIFLTIFLIFIDVSCVLYKAGTKKGPYDDHINYETYLSDLNKKTQENILDTHLIAQKEFNQVEGKQNFITSIRAKQAHRENRESIQIIYENASSFNDRITNEIIRFREFISKQRSDIKKIKDEKIRDHETIVLDRIVTEFYVKINRSVDEFSKM